MYPMPQPSPTVGQPGAAQPGAAPPPGATPPQPQMQSAPAQPQYEQPHPTVQFGQNLPPQQPQNGQVQPPAQPQQPQRFAIDQDVILDGPNVPTELRGRTFGQAMRIYGALANDWLSRQNGQPLPTPGPGPQGAPPQGAPPAAPAPQPQGQPTPQGRAEPAAFWRDPGTFVDAAVERAMSRVMQPMMRLTQKNAIEQARDDARAMIPDWQQLEGAIMETVATADPQVLASPDYWIGAADLVRGRMMRARTPNPLPAPQPPAMPTRTPPSVPSSSYAFQQPNSFFTEAPSAPSIYSATPMGVLTPDEQRAAQAMGMTFDQYAAWKGGVTRGR